jgi:hypothetical protein
VDVYFRLEVAKKINTYGAPAQERPLHTRTIALSPISATLAQPVFVPYLVLPDPKLLGNRTLAACRNRGFGTVFRKFFYTGLAAAAALASALACPETAAAIPAASQNGPIAAQSVSLGTPEVPLTEWRYHPGDSPRIRESNTFLWADPAFDESSWKRVKTEPLSAQDIPYSQFFWYRSRVTISRQNPAQKLAVLLEITNTYQVYWNGQLLGVWAMCPRVSTGRIGP